MALQDTWALAKQEINDSEMRAHIARRGSPPVFEVHPLLYIVF